MFKNVNPGEKSETYKDDERKNIIEVTSGVGVLSLDGQAINVKKGFILEIYIGARFCLINTSKNKEVLKYIIFN